MLRLIKKFMLVDAIKTVSKECRNVNTSVEVQYMPVCGVTSILIPLLSYSYRFLFLLDIAATLPTLITYEAVDVYFLKVFRIVYFPRMLNISINIITAMENKFVCI